MKYKVAVIGGGPGGYVTAIRLNQLGIETVVFEKNRLGGVCLNWGCIPTKSLVKVADFYHEVIKADEFGINIENAKPDYKKIAERKDKIVERLVSGVEYIFKKRNIPVINESVISIQKKSDQYIIKSEKEDVEAEFVIIATGSKPKELPFMKFDHENILSSKDLLALREIPESLTVVGGGVIGCEFASIFSALGSQVNIIEFLPEIVPNEDKEISKRLKSALKKKKIKIKTNTAVESFETQNGKIVLNLSKGKPIETDKVLVSVGRQAQMDIEFIDCDIAMENQAVKIDANFMTSLPNIFAIGDLTEKQMLAHTASKQGVIVAKIINNIIADRPIEVKELNYYNIPKCTFTHPEIGSVGFTEEQAKDRFDEILVGKFPFAANGKALGMGATDGFVKVIADKSTKQVVGVHILGANATELIATAEQIINQKISIEELDNSVWAHPTLSEIMGEAIEDLENLAIHKI